MVEKLTAEERALRGFHGPGPYPMRLRWYLEQPEKLAMATRIGSVSISTTKTFRRYVHRFIRNFQPERLLPEKNLWLDLGWDGVFYLRQGKYGQRLKYLSETDTWVFHYMCFLHLRRFWNGVRRWSHFPMLTYPVAIRDFSNRLDEGVDFSALLQRAHEVEGKLILIKQIKWEA